MAERKAFDWQVLLVVAGVLVGVVVLLRLALARSATVVQQPQSNPLIAAIDNVPDFIKAVGGFVGDVFTRRDSNPTGIEDDTYDVSYVDELPI